MSETLKQRLITAADAIDERLGPITGTAADRLAPLLREAARTIPPPSIFHGIALLQGVKETDTALVAVIGECGTMAQTLKHAGRPRDLVDLASSPLEQAADIIDEDDDPSAEIHALRVQISSAAMNLPNRFEEDADG